MLLTGIFILFWLQYQFTIMKLQDLKEKGTSRQRKSRQVGKVGKERQVGKESSFLSKSAQVISVKDSMLIK